MYMRQTDSFQIWYNEQVQWKHCVCETDFGSVPKCGNCGFFCLILTS